MTLAEVKSMLSKHPDLPLRFQTPDGKRIPAHAHVTEVGRVEKRFMDCGGTLRSETACRLQLWVAKDFWHRFDAGKLLAILNRAQPVLETDDLPVEIEYELGVLTHSPVEAIIVMDNELVLRLNERRTACLAKEEKAAKGFFRSWNLFGRSRG